MPRSVRTWRMISLSFVLIFTVEQRASSLVVLRNEVGANDGRDDFDGTDASLPEKKRKDDVSSEARYDDEKLMVNIP